MTHDDILKKVQADQAITEYLNKGLMKGDIAINVARQHWFQSNALRAVVELHKPKDEIIGMGVTFEGATTSLSSQLRCACSQLYPCRTIEAIEKELA